jgi:NADH:ubiquinone oxidoreductase subunit 6 (subunit J)
MDAINWHTFFFLLFSLVACAFAVAVVISSNIVRMALYLIVSLGATSGLFFLAGADFVAAMQLMIYVGGTLVLLIFGVMLTAKGPFVSMKTGGGDWILACLLSGCLIAFLIPAAFSVPGWRNQRAADERTGDLAASETEASTDAAAENVAGPPQVNTATPLGMGLLGPRVDQLSTTDETLRAGMSGYLLPFEIISVHLLVVLVGAAYLARTKRRADVRVAE